MSIQVPENVTHEELTRLIIDGIGESNGDPIKVIWMRHQKNCRCLFSTRMLHLTGVSILVDFIWSDINEIPSNKDPLVQ